MIRRCGAQDFDAVWEIINDAAQAYRGIIPADRWHEPYMTREALAAEIADGVAFWGFEEDGALQGVMGSQDRGDVTLIRHAYVHTARRRAGIGGALLAHLERATAKPILIGTWAAASWAVRFYEKHGYRLVATGEKDRLLAAYWRVPARQVETSVVLVSPRWFENTERIGAPESRS
ncbi:MAG: GNAT family N-acetyltransferase [Burkholderiales bacterium]|nr:GNAT family N-acetyltransferase [Burkholderiales bacterium]